MEATGIVWFYRDYRVYIRVLLGIYWEFLHLSAGCRG